MPYIYMVRCTDRSLYTGITTDMARRMREHCGRKKSGAKYTKSHPLQSLEMVWEAETWTLAAKLEYRIKQLEKNQKEELLSHPEKVNEWPSLRQPDVIYRPHPEMNLDCFLSRRNDTEESS